MPLAGTVLLELAPISYGRIIYEVTSVTLGSLLLVRPPKSKPFTPLFSCKPAARGLPATYDHTLINTSEPTGIPAGHGRTRSATEAAFEARFASGGRVPGHSELPS